MNAPCANESELAGYMREVDRTERVIDAIKLRANELLASDYPIDASMVLEALSEDPQDMAIAIEKHAPFCESSNPQLRALHLEEVGRQVMGAIDSYRRLLATRKAADEINNAACVKCYDAGCPSCDPADEH